MGRARRWLGRWSAQAVGAGLGALLVILAAAETVWPGGLDPVLPHAAVPIAAHWTIGLVLLIGAFAGPGTARGLLVAMGMVLVAAGSAELALAGPAGEALGLSGPVPVPSAVLHVVLGALVAGASLVPAAP